MKRLRIVAATIAVVCIGAMIALGFYFFRGESLYDCTFRLQSNKDAFKIGDEVVLTAEVIPTGTRTLTLSDQVYRNLRVWGMKDAKEGLPNEGAPVKHVISPSKPLRIAIKGQVLKQGDGSIMVDFSNYGRCQIIEYKFPPLRFTVLPYKIRIADSVEWDASNELQLQLLK